MSEDEVQRIRALVDAVYRADSRQVLATLIRLLGDFDAAEEALHDAFTAAVERWTRDGVPAKPRAVHAEAPNAATVDRSDLVCAATIIPMNWAIRSRWLRSTPSA